MFQRTARGESVDQMIAKGNYKKAVALLRNELKQHRRSVHLRQKLADTLVKLGEIDEAVQILLHLVDEFADGGFWAKAIAVLKKLERIRPDLPGVEKRLASVIAAREEEYSSSFVPPAPATRPAPAARVAAPKPAPAPAAEQAPATPSGSEICHEAASADSILFELDPELFAAAGSATSEEIGALQGSPLFRDLSEDEVIAVIRGLKLRTFEPGEIIITEGEPGSSMYLIASGAARVYVRNAEGGNVFLRVMGLGEFFGEISLFARRNRTTTITAADRCELLELDQDDLRTIGEQHVHLLSIIEEFCIRRIDSEEEKKARRSSAFKPE